MSFKKAKDAQVLRKKSRLTHVEGKIRTDKYRNKFLEAVVCDSEKLFFNEWKRFISVRCPACDKNMCSKEFVKMGFSFCRCSNCFALFVNPRPTKEMLDNFYKHSKAIALSTKELEEDAGGRRKYIFTPRAELIIKELHNMGVNNGRLLEVGCSVGTFLEILSERTKFVLEGLDPSEDAFRIATKKGFLVHKYSLEDFVPGQEKYDIVLSFETLEHVFSPYDFVLKINSLLRKNGYFVFTTPNCFGFDMMVLGRDYKNVHAPCHINYFNTIAIEKLLFRTGFRVCSILTPGILDSSTVIKQIDDGTAKSIPDFIKHLLFKTSPETVEDFQNFLRRNKLSGHMLVFAKKN